MTRVPSHQDHGHTDSGNPDQDDEEDTREGDETKKSVYKDTQVFILPVYPHPGSRTMQQPNPCRVGTRRCIQVACIVQGRGETLRVLQRAGKGQDIAAKASPFGYTAHPGLDQTRKFSR